MSKSIDEIGGWQVICWSLVFSIPILIITVALVVLNNGISASASAWFGFGYVSIISMFLGFFAWYRGLAIGGIARVSQVQLLQPFLSISFSAIFLKEEITMTMIFTAIIVIISVAIGKIQKIEIV
ncbi:MAG: DMT family transporter [Rivularia sp. ALOHA_DT_140]|nr:DMT family transporter [Rivularia sp. ALOHA_DT_140]